MAHGRITLANTRPDDIASFKKELQEAFALAVVDGFGSLPDGPIPSDGVLDGAFMAPDAVVLRRPRLTIHARKVPSSTSWATYIACAMLR